MDTVGAVETVDARGLACPLPTVNLFKTIRQVEIGAIVEMWTDSESSQRNVPAWCRNTGHELVDQASEDGVFKFRIRRNR